MDIERPLVAPEDDFGLLCMVITNGVTAAVLERLAEAGLGDSKLSHGFVVQGLLAGDRTITKLAERLGISVQAVSKTVQEMERIGFVERSRDPEDARSWVLALSERGRAAVAESRRARFDVVAELRRRLGAARADETLAALRVLADAFGGLDALAQRRMRPGPDTASS